MLCRLLILVVSISTTTLADVYKIEENGKITYTSKSPGVGATPAKLPEIGRWQIAKINQTKSICSSHGGINCQLGPDLDGSVICMDGFKDSLERFKFQCSAAKLDIIEISNINEHGEFSVVVRNSKSVKANDTKVDFKPNKWDETIPLSGPQTMEPFEVVEFKYRPESKSKYYKPSLATLRANCSNCG